MPATGTLLQTDEALQRIERIEDPVTRTLVNMAFVQFVKKAHLAKRERPRADLDMLYVVETLEAFFADHDVLARTLQGEQVGAWFSEEG